LDTVTTTRFMSSPPLAHPVSCGRLAAVSLLTELDTFYTEHRACGDLAAGIDGPIVWIECECGTRMARQVNHDDRAGRGA
jgi:hypothetical protein